MKKFKKIYFTFLFSALMALSGVLVAFSAPQTKTVYAQEVNTNLPSNATFSKYTKTETNDYIKVSNSNILHQDAVFLDPEQVVIFEIGNPLDFETNLITDITPDVYINSESVGHGQFEIIDITDSKDQWAKMILDPYATSQEGKYHINLEYFDNNVAKQTISFTFYLYKKATYYSSNLPAVTVQNVNLTTPAMESASYARTHEFQYTNDYTSAQNLSLPTITFDSNKFEVSISKNHSGIIQSTYISLDANGNIVQPLPIVMSKKVDNLVTVTFNDLGAYTVSYFMLYKSETEKTLFSNINSTLKPDRMQLFGFQAYHSNINATSSTDQLKEFKVINEDHTIAQNFQTDITFTQIQNKFADTQNSFAKQILGSENKYYLENIDSRVIFNGDNLSAKSTNQAPVSFKYNATLVLNNSFYFKLTNQKHTSGHDIWEKQAYDGRAFSDVGTYLVKLTYTSDLSVTPSISKTQWFYFTISNQIPSHSVKANDTILSTGSFTKETVEVSFNQAYNPFNSESRLTVYRKANLTSASVLVKQVGYSEIESFSQDGIYTVELSRGRNFTSKSTSEFIIDTQSITGLVARDVNSLNNSFVKGSASGFYTNKPVAVEWNNKTTNNNLVSGYYKFIPLSQMASISPSEYANYYSQGQLIPVNYKLNYTESNNLSIIPYQNTLALNTLTNSNIFSQEGLYMVRAVDKAGNEAFTYFFIDKTTPTVLQKDALGNYLSDFTKLNIVSETVTLQWGNYKVIRTDLDLENINFDTWLKPGQTTTNLDPWLFKMLKEKANNASLASVDGDFKLATTGGKRLLHFSPKIDADNVMVAIGSSPLAKLENLTSEGLSKIGNHSVEVYATKTVNGVLVGLENSYTFQVNDESNKNAQPSTQYSVTTSTDVSKTQIKYKPENQAISYDTLTQHNYRVVDNDTSVLKTYYMPINTDVLQLEFLTTTDESSIEIESVRAYFYPYISDYVIYTGNNSMLNKGAPTFYTMDELILYTGATNPQNGLVNNQEYTLEYLIDNNVFPESHFTVGRSLVLAKTPQETLVYDYETTTNLATLENGMWVWNINFEEIYVSNVSKQQTQAGKYEIVRTYRNNSQLESTLKNKADFMTRHLTFMVEREGVISKAEDNNNMSYSLVGGSAYIEILAGSNNPQNKYTALYNAISHSKEQQFELLETNKLPVKLGFPISKFGQVVANDFNLLSNNYFYANSKDAYINTFEMGLKVTHLATGNVFNSNVSITVTDSQPANSVAYVRLDNGLYLTFTNVQNGYITIINPSTGLEQTFTQEGKYQVDFFQKNTALKGKTEALSMFFQITNIAPNFDIVDEFGKTLPKHENEEIYYANQNQVTITWTDSSNPYYAKINHATITYTVNNGSAVKPTRIDTQADGVTHSFTIPTTLEASSIIVRMQYEGNRLDYATGAFEKAKTIIVDKTAPTASINKMLARMGDASLFNAQSLRDGHDKASRYNRTISTGNFADFAFAVDKSNLESLILSNLNSDTQTLYFKEIANKYTNSIKEFDPTQNDALWQLSSSGDYSIYHSSSAFFNSNTYYEFAEVDKAGNITVYTIYLTDVNNMLAQEQQLKNDDVSYQDFLSDAFKVVSYTSYKDNDSEQTVLNRFETVLETSQANNNLKVYSKQYFNLKDLNPYGYEWFLLTFGTNKYLSSPKTQVNGEVYKIQGSAWTTVKLENEIYLTLSRNNYILELKNLSVNNIVLNVVISNAQLAFVAPQANNSSLTITSTRANDTEYVEWKTVSIWEYQNGIYSAYALLDTSQNTPIERDPELEGFNLASYTKNNLTTVFNINTKNQAYYRFKIVDNFGLEYIMYYLAGTQFVEKIEELEGRTLISDNSIEETPYYLSNTGFKYTYYPALTQEVEIKIGVLNLEDLTIQWKTYTLPADNNLLDQNYASIADFGSYKTITLRALSQQTSNKYLGNSIIYTIKAKTLAPTKENPNFIEEETTNFKVYSILPKTILTGKNKQDLSDILLKNQGIISEPITIEFANTANFDYPAKVYLSFNGQTKTELQSGQTFSQVGAYVITKEFVGAMGNFQVAEESFVISDQASTFFSIVQYNEVSGKYEDVALTNDAYKLEIPLQFEQTSITQHYIVNTTDWKINLSASQFMEIVPNEGVFAGKDEVRKNGVTTFIKTLSNHNTQDLENKSFSYHKTTIAVTYIPKQNKIVRDFYYLDNQANQIFLTNSEKTYSLVKDEDKSNQVEVYFNSYHLIPENKITASIYFGQDKQPLSSSVIRTRNATTNYVTLTRSGNYSFVFTDRAGNVHKFDYNSQITESSSAYEFVFLNNVIFTVNEQAPIQYAIYNDAVQITLPSHTMTYYDNNARPIILVTRDLEVVTDYKYDQKTRTYTFEKPGLYKILFSAKIGSKEVKQEPFFFEIIKEKEIAWVFNVEKYGNYYIEKIEKNNIDVTNNLSNSSLGELVSVNLNGVQVNRLKNLVVSLFDEQTGAGNWAITINTNNELNQKFNYKFTISDTNPPIEVSVPEGTQTTDTINVSFNARNLYENVGEAIVKIGSQEIYLNEAYFTGNYVEIQNISITAIGDSYIQVFTPSGRLVYTYRVTRTTPLNTVAIIIIVVSVLAGGGLVVMFVMLRKRMKIR